MLNRFFGSNTHDYLHVLGVSGLAFGLPMNKVVMSISMMFIALNFLLEGDFKIKLYRLKKSRLFLLVLAFVLLHVIALLWTSNFDYALHDLKAKLPLFVIGVLLFAKPIKYKDHIAIVLGSFLLSILITSFINFGAYNQWFGNWVFDDIRGMSLFGSHVRYSLLISMAVAVTLFLSGFRSNSWLAVRVGIILWLVFYTYTSQVLSGYLSLAGVSMVAVIYWLWGIKKWLAISSIVLTGVLTIIIGFWVLGPINFDPSEYENLDLLTEEGNPYYHGPKYITPETKKPIEIYICDIELKREWEQVSTIPFDSTDLKGQPLRITLIRYMSSLEYRKDAKSFQKLSKSDIANIEQGHASAYHTGLMARVYGLQFQLNNPNDPNGHSFLQRIEYWKTGLMIARQNIFVGVGTGDVQDEFNSMYNATNSPLDEEYRRRAHNMFLTVLITFGIFGLFLFIWLHSEFFFKAIGSSNMIAVAFIVIVLLSYLVEDTLETQTGITFFALFYSLFSPKDN